MEISEELDTCFFEGTNNQTNFNESFAKCHQLVPKMSRNDKRNNERKITKKVVNKIKERNDKYAANRLYGGDFSLNGWDAERKRKGFETVDEARKRSEENAKKIVSGKKKTKDHIGKFSSYKIDTAGLDSLASSWTSETKVIWKK